MESYTTIYFRGENYTRILGNASLNMILNILKNGQAYLVIENIMRINPKAQVWGKKTPLEFNIWDRNISQQITFRNYGQGIRKLGAYVVELQRNNLLELSIFSDVNGRPGKRWGLTNGH